MLKQLSLIGVTMMSKVIGLLREILLLGAIGVSRELDNFLFFFGVSGLLMILMASTIYTNLTPYVAQILRDQPEGKETAQAGPHIGQSSRIISELISDSVLLGVLAALVCAMINLALYAGLNNAGSVTDTREPSLLVLALLPCIALLFNVMAEYCSAILTARKEITPIIFGNIFISAPSIAFLFIFEVTLFSYTIVFALSYGLRAAFLLAALKRSQHLPLHLVMHFQQSAALTGIRAVNLISGSAMTVVQLAFTVALLASRILPEGSTTLYSYAIKIPYLYFSTVWFVLGAGFFARLVNQTESNAFRNETRLLIALNICAMMLGGLTLWALINWDGIESSTLVQDYSVTEIARITFWILPIIILMPIIDIGQKVLATTGHKAAVLQISLAIAITVGLLIPAALLGGKVEYLLLAISIGFAMGAGAALRILRQDLSKPEIQP